MSGVDVETAAGEDTVSDVDMAAGVGPPAAGEAAADEVTGLGEFRRGSEGSGDGMSFPE